MLDRISYILHNATHPRIGPVIDKAWPGYSSYKALWGHWSLLPYHQLRYLVRKPDIECILMHLRQHA